MHHYLIYSMTQPVHASTHVENTRAQISNRRLNSPFFSVPDYKGDPVPVTCVSFDLRRGASALQDYWTRLEWVCINEVRATSALCGDSATHRGSGTY